MFSVLSNFDRLLIAGCVRAFIKINMADTTSTTLYHDGKYQTIKRPYTFTERLGISALGAVVFPWTFPLALYNDINRVELHVRGFESARSEAKINNVFDILF